MTEKKPSPTIATLRMVEKTIKEHNGDFARTALWKAVPKAMKYSTFQEALFYFSEHNQIVFKDGKIIWIHFPKLFDKLMEQTVPLESIKKEPKPEKSRNVYKGRPPERRED